jgi:ABC-type lipoprotein export system ATPase subunit
MVRAKPDRREIEASGGAPAIDLRAVGRVYPSGGGELVALRHVDLRVDEGESLAVTGPSGSGKTTLLNLIAGLDRPSVGEVRVLGRLLNHAREAELTAFRAGAIGLVFQDPHLLPGLTALENVIAARLPWASWHTLEAEARELLAAVGLAGRLHLPAARLSGGERQRVGIARALLGRPRLLLADEPSGDLDLTATEEVLTLLTEVRLERALTLVVATHDPAMAAVADRIVRLAGGHVVQDRRHEGSGLLEVHRLEP